MRYRHGMLLLALGAAVAAGCGGSGQSPSSSISDQPQSGATASAEQVGPAETVTAFLDAVRRGDDVTAAAMFTETARQRASQMNIEVAPQGSDTARFGVGEVEYVDDALARVQSTWTDYDQEGQLRTDEMAWMLRREPEGWRVAGMAATVFPGESPLLLDFENPQETLRKLELLKEEVRRRSEAEAYQAAQPRSPTDPFRR